MSNKKIIIIIFLLAIFTRIGGNVVRENLFFKKPLLLFGKAYDAIFRYDNGWYDGAARAFLKGKGVVSMDENRRSSQNRPAWISTKKIDDTYYAHDIIPPLYPLFLAVCYYIGGMNTLAYFIPQLILGALTCVFIFIIAGDIFSRKVAVVAGFITACYPDLIIWTNFVRTETLFIFLLVLSFLFMIKGHLRNNIYFILIGAIIFGLTCLTRVTAILFIPLLLFWIAFSFKNNRKKGILIGIVAVLLIILVLLPWCLRNYFVFKNFTPFTSEIYGVLSWWDKPGEDSPDERQQRQLEGEYFYRSYNSSFIRIVAFIKKNFWDWTRNSFRRMGMFWSPYTLTMRKMAKVYKGLTWLMIFPLAFWGIITSQKTMGWGGKLLIIFIFYHCLLHAGSYVDDGLVYRYPIQPFICIFTSFGFWAIYKKFKFKKGLIVGT